MLFLAHVRFYYNIIQMTPAKSIPSHPPQVALKGANNQGYYYDPIGDPHPPKKRPQRPQQQANHPEHQLV